MNRPGYIYVGQLHYVYDDSVILLEKKIGLTSRLPKWREKEIVGVKTPVKYRNLGYWYVADMYTLETELHHLFKDQWLEGEWFSDIDESLYQDVRSYLDNHDSVISHHTN